MLSEFDAKRPSPSAQTEITGRVGHTVHIGSVHVVTEGNISNLE